MRKFLFTLFIFSTVVCFGQRDYTALVNPFIGTGGHGHTYPGASRPFGMMQLSPDTRGADWDGSSGYHYSDSIIYGFSHTHLSGTGIPDYCDVLFMPFTGEVKWKPVDYRASFKHKNEKASPGYYEVQLDNQIKVRLTTGIRSGMHEYSFPANTKEGNVLIDLKWRDEVLDSYIEQVDEHSLKGYRRSKSWAQDQVVYFYVEFEQPIQKFIIAENDAPINGKKTQGKNVKAILQFALSAGNKVKARIAISGVSSEGARANLLAEIKDWNFENLAYQAKAEWNKELSKVDVTGGTKDQQTIFYTALYHTFLVPNNYQDVDGQFRGTDKKIHSAQGFTNYTVFSLWDTYRAYHPLMTILNQKRTADWINTFLAQYQQGGMLPVWELSGNETFCMIGYHSVPVIVDAYEKGIRGFDAKLALQAMRSYAEGNRFGLPFYRQFGYLSNDKEHESVSKTLEYAYDDWCIARFAKMLGTDSIYKQYIQRAQYYKNVFDPETHNMRGKMQAMWYAPFDPKEINNFYTEGNAWQYTFAVPQDIETLMKLHGGKEAFAGKLEELFTTSSKTTGREQADVTGLIGQYAQGNEPSHHMAYLFNYAGRPWRTQELVSKICTEFYTNAPDGLIGNEDCGQMSAWFVFSAMGLYPVCPGTGEYVLGTPLFDKVVLRLENGKRFEINAKGKSQKACYVAATLLNGSVYSKSYLPHSAILKGGKFDFVIAAKPNLKWGAQQTSWPHSSINDHLIVPVPYVSSTSNKFTQSMPVSIQDVQPDVMLKVNVGNKPYELTSFDRIIVKQTTDISAYAVKGKDSSKLITQRFYKLPSDISINVLSRVHPMYTAGGPEALIDGIEGTSNWRSGEWQSYFNQDFEAIVDLKQNREIHYLGIHVLQDVSPWIIYPKEVIFYTSNDGEQFTEITRVKNKIDNKDQQVQTQELGTTVNTSTRFIKVKALNGGRLPEWHESAGNPSHLFIDEVVVK